MIRKLLQGIPKKLLICNAIFTIIWGLMNSYMKVTLAKVTAVSVEQKTFVCAALFFIGYILVWEAAEFVCDMCNGMQDAYVRNESYRYYYKKIYETKPSVLQKENTGYVAGILTQLIERKAKMMQSILLASISIIYIGYLIVYIGKYSAWFSLKKGERVCITGESGQGKTTMLKLLSGMIETEGKMFVDGKETKKNIDAVFIAQDTEMLDMTLRENLTFGKEDISDEELVSMMEEVGMGGWLEKQKDNYSCNTQAKNLWNL